MEESSCQSSSRGRAGSIESGKRPRPCFSKSAAQRWAQDCERDPRQHGPPAVKKEVPSFEIFAPRFVDGHARANRHKPSGMAATESMLRCHLIPMLGAKQLDKITNEQVQRLKLTLAHSHRIR